MNQEAVTSSHEDKIRQNINFLKNKKLILEQSIREKIIKREIVCQKRQLQLDLQNDSARIKDQISLRNSELQELIKRINYLKASHLKLQPLQELERKFEGELEDFQQLKAKLTKELKMLVDQEQIRKGKAIIQYNKIVDIKDEIETQMSRNKVLKNHLDDVRRGAQNLRKKAKTLNQSLKAHKNKNKINEQDIVKQIQQLSSQFQQKTVRFNDLLKTKEQYILPEQYNKCLDQLQKLKKQTRKFDQQVKLNEKLLEDKAFLEERVKFLEGVDIEFVNQKKLSLTEINQSNEELLIQKMKLVKNLEGQQRRLAEIKEKSFEQISTVKKKSQHKSKQPKKNKPKQESIKSEITQIQQKQPFRWRGHKLKKIIISIAIFLLVIGLIIHQIFHKFI